jgi:large subunit ribosomal protein L28
MDETVAGPLEGSVTICLTSSIHEGDLSMAKCEVCGKGPQFGHNVSHSMRHTKRRWNPNVQRMRLSVGGQERRVYICAKCIKTMQKAD